MNIKPYCIIEPKSYPVSFFGCCIRAFEDVLVIGARCGSPYDPVAPGFVDIYINEVYVQTLFGKTLGERFGVSIALNAEYLCIGAYRENTNGIEGGSVYVYKRVNNYYKFNSLLFAPDKKEKDYFGYNISIEDNYLVVGAYAKNLIGSEDGKVYIFNLDSNECISQIINNFSIKNENFGRSVYIYNKKIFVGSPKNNENGKIFVYDLDGKLLEVLESNDTKRLGNSICINEKFVIAGAYETKGKGSVCIYDVASKTWKMIFSDCNKSYFGGSISVSNDMLSIGSYRYGNNEQGSVFIYNLTNDEMNEISNPNGNSNDWFGYSVFLNNKKLYIGSVKNNLLYVYKLD